MMQSTASSVPPVDHDDPDNFEARHAFLGDDRFTWVPGTGRVDKEHRPIPRRCERRRFSERFLEFKRKEIGINLEMPRSVLVGKLHEGKASLRRGDKVHVFRKESGSWLIARVIDLKSQFGITKVKVRFGVSKLGRWIDTRQERISKPIIGLCVFDPEGLKEGIEVLARTPSDNSEWTKAKVITVSPEQGQVSVKFVGSSDTQVIPMNPVHISMDAHHHRYLENWLQRPPVNVTNDFADLMWREQARSLGSWRCIHCQTENTWVPHENYRNSGQNDGLHCQNCRNIGRSQIVKYRLLCPEIELMQHLQHSMSNLSHEVLGIIASYVRDLEERSEKVVWKSVVIDLDALERTLVSDPDDPNILHLPRHEEQLRAKIYAAATPEPWLRWDWPPKPPRKRDVLFERRVSGSNIKRIREMLCWSRKREDDILRRHTLILGANDMMYGPASRGCHVAFDSQKGFFTPTSAIPTRYCTFSGCAIVEKSGLEKIALATGLSTGGCVCEEAPSSGTKNRKRKRETNRVKANTLIVCCQKSIKEWMSNLKAYSRSPVEIMKITDKKSFDKFKGKMLSGFHIEFTLVTISFLSGKFYRGCMLNLPDSDGSFSCWQCGSEFCSPQTREEHEERCAGRNSCIKEGFSDGASLHEVKWRRLILDADHEFTQHPGRRAIISRIRSTTRWFVKTSRQCTDEIFAAALAAFCEICICAPERTGSPSGRHSLQLMLHPSWDRYRSSNSVERKMAEVIVRRILPLVVWGKLGRVVVLPKQKCSGNSEKETLK